MTKKLRVVDATDPGSIPDGLGPNGRLIWEQIMAEYDIADIGGRIILTQICKAEDRAETCHETVKRDGEMIRTKAGTWRSHPLIREELQLRAFICRQLTRLGITLEPTKPTGRPPSPVGVSWER